MDGASIIRYIFETYPDADILTAGSGTFFSCDPDKHWPNFATLVTSDAYETASNLDRPDVYRFNIGVSQATFESVVGSMSNPDYTALDQLMPHPIYAQQHWVCILNPSAETFDTVLKPLLAEGHERVARGRRKVARARPSGQRPSARDASRSR